MPIRDHNPSNKFPIVTVAIIAINIFVFLQEITSPDIEAFIRTYGLVRANLVFSDQSTLTNFITGMFLHGGVLHIASNMLFLWVFGDNIEAALGKIKFSLFYLVGGIVASLVQLPFTPESVPLVGASGAIAAVLGGYLVLYPSARIDVIVPIFFLPTIITVPASFMLIYWFVIQILSGAISLGIQTESVGGIAFFAHVGGFLAGVLLINLLRPKRSLSY